MKFRFASFAAFSALALVSCKDQSSFKLSGTVNNPDKIGKVYLIVADTAGTAFIDSAVLGDSHTFEFKHNAPYANLYKVKLGKEGPIFDFVLKNGDDVKFSTDASDVAHTYEVSGSDESEKIKEFNTISTLYGNKNSKLSEEYTAKSEALGHPSDSLLKIYMPVFQKNIADYSTEILKFINDNKKSLTGFYAATSLDQFKYEQQLVAYADEIKDNFKDNPAVQTFIRQMELVKPISVGHKAPEFTAKSIDDKDVKLSDYKGKYVMIDFWASWCAPCRQENPNVVKQYAAFHNKGFEILGVSLDTEKKDWAGAIKADGLKWTHVSDLQRFEGPTERLYHIEAIPSNFLVDPSGNIVAKNITGADLETFLKKTFN
ncbi:hypothetical protein A0256_18475 [Mucilaginibacter sp. PAMC 26640]|nr:hypothetical protein A0256_18475 [Mucilaginibacter sp. PAMC 26640]